MSKRDKMMAELQSASRSEAVYGNCFAWAHDEIERLTLKLGAVEAELAATKGGPVSCGTHGWVGDDDCAYCRIDEIEAKLANRDDDAAEAESRLAAITALAERWRQSDVAATRVAGGRVLRAIGSAAEEQRPIRQCELHPTYDPTCSICDHMEALKRDDADRLRDGQDQGQIDIRLKDYPDHCSDCGGTKEQHQQDGWICAMFWDRTPAVQEQSTRPVQTQSDPIPATALSAPLQSAVEKP